MTFIFEQDRQSKLQAFHFLRQVVPLYLPLPSSTAIDLNLLTYTYLEPTATIQRLAHTTATSRLGTCVVYGLLLGCLDVDLQKEADILLKSIGKALALSILKHTREQPEITNQNNQNNPISFLLSSIIPSSSSPSSSFSSSSSPKSMLETSSATLFCPSGLVLTLDNEDNTITILVNAIAALLSDSHIETRTLACTLLRTTYNAMQELIGEKSSLESSINTFCRMSAFYDVLLSTLVGHLQDEPWSYSIGLFYLCDDLLSYVNPIWKRRILPVIIPVLFQSIQLLPEDAWILHHRFLCDFSTKLVIARQPSPSTSTPTSADMMPSSVDLYQTSPIENSTRFHFHHPTAVYEKEVIEMTIEHLFTGSIFSNRLASSLLPSLEHAKTIVMEAAIKHLQQINYIELPLVSRMVVLRAVISIFNEMKVADDRTWSVLVVDLFPVVIRSFLQDSQSLEVPPDPFRM